MEEVEYSTVGSHIIVDFWGVEFDKLNIVAYMEFVLHEAVQTAGATVLHTVSHKFEPNGCTVLLLLSESHASFHTYPEKGYVSLDIYTCGETIDPYKGFEVVKHFLEPTHIHIKSLKRGLGEDKPIQVVGD
jgi:S-adenosylmethionine decarboxylase